MRKIFRAMWLVALYGLGSCALGQAGGSGYNSNELVSINTDGSTYYHLQFEITPDKLVGLDQLSEKQLIRNSGQFELELDKSNFPVEAPNCQGNIILRMPWTIPDKKNTRQSITEKTEVYEAIDGKEVRA